MKSADLSLLRAGSEEPHRPALIAGDRTHTFGELAARAAPIVESFATDLEGDRGPRPAAAVVGSNRLGSLLAIYALIEGGWPFVLVHPRLTPAERRRLLEPLRLRLIVDRDPAPSEQAPVWRARRPPDEREWLAVLYTSGSSGRPKGVALSRAAFLAAARGSAENLGWRDDDRWLLSMPIAHVGGLSVLIRCLLARRTVVLDDGDRFEAARIAQLVSRHRITLLSLVPTMLHRLLTLDPPWQPPATLRAILLGGAAAPVPLLGRAAERGLPVLTSYGLTEACSQVATQPYSSRGRVEPGVGLPLPGLEVRIGGDGEGPIELRGPTLLEGYLEAGGLVDPLTGDGWFITGDLGRLDAEGRLHVVGRSDELLRTGGESVHPVEVEQVLEAHPGVARACVVGLEDEEWGERLVAVLEASRSGPASDDDLARYLEPRLAGFKRPRRLIWCERLPETPAGKLDRRAVRKICYVGKASA